MSSTYWSTASPSYSARFTPSGQEPLDLAQNEPSAPNFDEEVRGAFLSADAGLRSGVLGGGKK